MEIISWQFAVFVLITLVVYYLLSMQAQNVWLLIASFIFYATWGFKLVIIIALVTLLNFFLGIKIENGDTSQKRRRWLWLGLILNAGSLVCFRLFSSGYAGRLFDLLTRALNSNTDFFLQIILPLGFSFYILQAISYLVDVSRRQLPASKNLVDFSLYMAYFPRLTAGPIERARDFIPQLSQPRFVDNKLIRRGFTLILIGLVRKLLFAEILSRNIPGDLFYTPAQYPSIELVFYLLLFAFWLYNDFAGYTSIVRGVSCFYGIELSPNFNQPYFARSFVDFWNRWHITLSHWLRDYIYIPISRSLLRRNRSHRNLVNIFLPPVVTMFVSGLWHNFGVYMLVWGGMHGVYQAVERMAVVYLPHSETPPFFRLRRLASILLVFIFTNLAWVAFASGSFTRALNYWNSLFTTSVTPSIAFTSIFLSSLVILICLVLDWFQYHSYDEVIFLQWSRTVQVCLLVFLTLCFFTYFLLVDTPAKPFIYQGF